MCVTHSPALQSERSENASCGGTACRAGSDATDVRSVDTSVEPPQHRVKLQLVNAVLPGIVLASTWKRIWECIDEIGAHLVQVE